MYTQCFICREWSWDVSRCWSGVQLCLHCYVDILEVRQARGVMGEPEADAGPPEATIPGNSPSPYRQLELWPNEFSVINFFAG